MFAQSLSKGSEEAQVALQRLTSFLEVEGASGRISPALQKKVLGKLLTIDLKQLLLNETIIHSLFCFPSAIVITDVLLVALSDCLAENPQLIATARLSLGGQFPKQLDKH